MGVQANSEKRFKNISMPRLFLHLEGLGLLAGSVFFYTNQQFGWGWFALFLLTPDLVMLVYMINKHWGEVSYNLVHTTIFPLILTVVSVLAGSSLGLQISLIWLAHIGMDRLVGYGFKYPGSFKETHFSRI